MTCVAFGAGTQGQLGNGKLEDSLVPCPVLGAQGVQSVICGANHAICLTGQQGVLYVWGVNHLDGVAAAVHYLVDQQRQQQSGVSVRSPDADAQVSDTPSSNTASAVEAVPGSSSGSGLSAAAAPAAVGHAAAICCRPQLLQLPGIAISRVVAGWEHTLMLTGGGRLFVAGDNSFGQLGVGQQLPASNRLLPLELPHLAVLPSSNQPAASEAAAAGMAEAATGEQQHCRAVVVDVAAGMRHSLALVQKQSAQQAATIGQKGQLQQPNELGDPGSMVLGWGSNKRQQLGPTSRLVSHVASSHPAAHTAAAASAAAAPRGRGSGAVVWQPCVVSGLACVDVAKLSAGGERSAAITKQGHLLLWGRPLPGHTAAAAAEQHTSSSSAAAQACMQLTWLPQPTRQAEWSTSHNYSSSSSRPAAQGSSSTLHQPQQQQSSGMANNAASSAATAAGCECLQQQQQQQLAWRAVCLGWRHLVAMDAGGQVWCAGDNSLGQLGIGYGQQQQQQQASTQAEDQQHQDQQLKKQVQQQQQLLLGESVVCKGLQLVKLPAPARCVAAGAEHCAAVLADGSVWTWGWGEHGQLGTGSTADATLPQKVMMGVAHLSTGAGDADEAGRQGTGAAQQQDVGQEGVDRLAASAAVGGPDVSGDRQGDGPAVQMPLVTSWVPGGVACGSGFTVVWAA